MRGLSPTSSELAGTSGDPAKSLSAKEKMILTSASGRPFLGPKARVADSAPSALMGGKDYGADDVPCVRYETRRGGKRLEKPATSRPKRPEALSLWRVDRMPEIGNRTFRIGVGNCLSAVGVSPRSARAGTGNR